MEKIAERNQKTALITGASEGIGREFALKLAAQGYRITAVARNGIRLDSLLEELPGSGHRKLIANLSTPTGVQAVVTELSQGYSLLVNNAGFGGIGEFTAQPIETIREMIALNVLAVVELSHAFLQRASKGDGLINVSSTLSLLPMPAQPVYSATKAFVTSFSEALWFQARKKGVAVLNLCPGATRSEFTSRAGGNAKDIPDAVLETAEQVAEFALRSYVEGRGPTVISGWKNRFMVLLACLASRKRIVKIMGALRA